MPTAPSRWPGLRGQTNSATSQWFFNLKTTPAWIGRWRLYGVRPSAAGTNVLNRFLGGDASTGIYTVDIGGALTTLPVLSATPGSKTWFTWTSRSQCADRATTRRRGTISWQSVSNKLNRVEFTTRMPPVWTELTSTNGTGQFMQVTDPVVDPNRFYRVRVDY